MKRIIAILAMLIAAASVFAVSTGTIGTDATQLVELKIGDDLYSYNVGFNTAASPVEGDIEATTLALDESDRTVATNSTDLYVWWDILTANNFTVTISMDGALEGKSTDGGVDLGESIDYTVVGAVQDGEVAPESSGATAISLDSKNYETPSTILDVESGTAAKSFQGQQKLTITTAEGALQGKPEGTYSSTLTLTVAEN